MEKLFVLIVAGFLAGFVDAVAGGGGLISLPTLLALGFPAQLALGSNKVIGISMVAASTFRYGISSKIPWKDVTPVAANAFLASIVGAWTATQISPRVLQPIILIGLVLVASCLLSRKRFGLETQPKRLFHPLWLCLFGFFLGFYDGFFGPGTGTFLMMGFVLFFGKDLLTGSASSRFVNLASNLGAVLLFGFAGQIDVLYVVPAAIASIAGALCGATWSLQKGSKAIRPVFIAVVWLLIARVVWGFF